MALSPFYNWSEPDNTSLVKDGAQAMRTLGDAIDASVWNVGFGQAGKNKIINGDFGIWQRGTSFSNPNDSTYTSDRWIIQHDGTGATRTISQQTFTPGTAPVAGYEGQYFLQYAVSGGTSNTYQQIEQRVENVRTFAGQTVTFSFWAKGDAARTISILNNRNFGSGGSSADQSSIGSTLNITTSWARYSVTATLASIAGKTIGAGSYSSWIMRFAAATAQTIQIWGVQLEYGSKATPFQTASGGSPQAELAMCQRYYYRATFDSTANRFGVGTAWTATQFFLTVPFPVTMRTKPTALEQSGTATDYTIVAGGSTLSCSAVPAFFTAHTNQAVTELTVAAGLTSGWAGFMRNANTNAYLGWSAEL